jgi:hypothetical protein
MIREATPPTASSAKSQESIGNLAPTGLTTPEIGTVGYAAAASSIAPDDIYKSRFAGAQYSPGARSAC